MTVAAVPSEQSLAPAEGKPESLAPAASPLVPRNLTEASDLASLLAKSSLVPEHFKGNVSNVFWAIAQGLELGLPPVAALSGIFAVHGKPGMYADLMVALVLRSGLAHYFSCVEADDDHAVYETHRRGAPAPRRLTITMADAERAKWTAQNPKYATEPRTMLSARCKSSLAKDVYPDVIRGIASVEELRDEQASSPLGMSGFRAPTSVERSAIDVPSAETPASPPREAPAAIDLEAVIAAIAAADSHDALEEAARRAKGVKGDDRKRVLAAYQERLKDLVAASKPAGGA